MTAHIDDVPIQRRIPFPSGVPASSDDERACGVACEAGGEAGSHRRYVQFFIHTYETRPLTLNGTQKRRSTHT